MNKKQDEFFKELLADFKVEAAEHTQSIIRGLLELEKGLPETEMKSVTENIFREIHSLKGAARAVSLLDIERFCQAMESIFSILKKQSVSLNLTFFNAFHTALDLLNQMLDDLSTGNKTVKGERIVNSMKEIHELSHSILTIPVERAEQTNRFDPVAKIPLKHGHPVDPEEQAMHHEPILSPVQISTPREKTSSPETVRISTSKLTEILLQTEELITIKNTLNHHIKEILELGREKPRNQGMADPEEQLRSLRRNLIRATKPLEQFNRNMIRTIDDLLIGIKNTLLLPFSSILDLFPKLVRDLSHDQKKDISFTIIGGDTEIDRRILEEIKDPLIHLIRNSIDHGIETPPVRMKSGKPTDGSLIMEITKPTNREVLISITDDGSGISREKVLNAAIKNGIITEEKRNTLSDQEVWNLIFHSGLSTSPFITDISGRGLGLAIVAEKISKLGGYISMESTPGKGTTFRLTLPLTLAIFRGLLVRISDQLLVIPTNHIERAIRIGTTDIKTVENQETITSNGEVLNLMRLGNVLNIPFQKSRNGASSLFPVLILTTGHRKMAFAVDEVLNEQEGIVKTLGSQLVHVQNITGATLLGDGKIVPILNISEIMESARSGQSATSIYSGAADIEGEIAETKSVLVAEDSVTARSLLRNILELAGYHVKTAVDGLEALQFLRNEPFDLVVSDVEMPGLNGFELTTKIRNDKNIADLPLILVTALESVDDRQRGMECGANAYIVKSSFEQSNLLEVIKRLI